MTTFWTWVSIVGLSMTPGLILGPSVAVAVGFESHISPLILLPIVAIANYIEGIVCVWLIKQSTRISLIERLVKRIQTPKAVAFAKKWGVWGGLIVGRVAIGQEPILAALQLLGIDIGETWLPLAISCIIFTTIYYMIVWIGLGQIVNL